MLQCPLCLFDKSALFYSDQRREYFQCDHCALVFVPYHFHLNEQEEKAEYDLHQNTLFDEGYRRFLSRLFIPLKAEIHAMSHTNSANLTNFRALDFGCGPGPALAQMFEEIGLSCHLYDKFYADNPAVLESKNFYDVITMTEVIEHLAQPRQVLEQLLMLLKPGGILGVMTKLVRDLEAFSHWHYKNDPTHISFYSYATLEYLAANYQLQLSQVADDAFIFYR